MGEFGQLWCTCDGESVSSFVHVSVCMDLSVYLSAVYTCQLCLCVCWHWPCWGHIPETSSDSDCWLQLSCSSKYSNRITGPDKALMVNSIKITRSHAGVWDFSSITAVAKHQINSSCLFTYEAVLSIIFWQHPGMTASRAWHFFGYNTSR